MLKKNSRRLALLIAQVALLSMLPLLPTSTVATAHAANVSGTVNTYYQVSSVAAGSVTLGGATAGPARTLLAGDRVVLIQMTGSIAEGLGRYELLTIDSVSGSTVNFVSGPTRTYDTTRRVQLVYMPSEAIVNVTAEVTPVPWNGTVGGVVALGGNELSLGANINANGAGYTVANPPSVSNGAAGAWRRTHATALIYAAAEGGHGGGGGVFGGGGGGGGYNNRVQDYNGTGGGGGAITTPGSGGLWTTGIVGGVGGAVGASGNGASARVGDVYTNDVGGGAGGGGSYGGGGAGCGTHYSSAYAAGGGGGGSYNGGGSGGFGGTNFGSASSPPPYTNPGGGDGNVAAVAALPLEGSVAGQHYFHTDDPRLMMGGGGGNSRVPAQGAGGAGGGVVILDFQSVSGVGNVVSANGVHGGRPSTGPSSGAGGGAGGQLYITASSFSALTVTANGGNGGANQASGAVSHTGSGGASGGGGGIWFAGAGADGTNSGSDLGANSNLVPPTAVVAVAGVTWSVEPGHVTVDLFSLTTLTAGLGTPITTAETGLAPGVRLDVDAAGNFRETVFELATGHIRYVDTNEYILGGTGPGGRMQYAIGPSSDYRYYDAEGRPINPKNTGTGCTAGTGGAGLVRTSAPAPDPDMTLSKVADVDSFDAVGDVITYTLVATNTGNVSLSGVSIVDPLPGLSELDCSPVAAATLATTESMTCTATYSVTQADLDRGVVENVATAAGTPPDGPPVVPPPAEEDVPGESSPAMTLTKVADVVSFDEVGDVITYTLVATNTGNVSLSDVSIDDPLPGLSELDCGPVAAATLDPTESMTCTATYSVTQADLDRGVVENAATAAGTPPDGPPVVPPPAEEDITSASRGGDLPNTGASPLAVIAMSGLLLLLGAAGLLLTRRRRDGAAAT